MKNKVIIFGLAIAFIVSVLAPFLASSNPDGLESAAENFSSAEGKDYVKFDSPMPDYAIEGMDKAGEVAAIVIGTFVVAALAYGVGLANKFA